MFKVLSLLSSALSLMYCVPALKVDKICDTGDPAKFLREAFMWRATTNQEFYCSLRIRDRANSGAGTTGIPTIKFEKTLYSGFQDEAYTITPTLGGGAVTSCTVTPTLPAGLSINATTCAITGTATTGGAGASYTITATNATGSATASTKIKVLGPNAFRVYGQNNFTTGVLWNNGSGTTATPSATNFRLTSGVAIDPNDNLYVGDQNTARVLFFLAGSTTASRVYGQHGNFNCEEINNNNNGSCIADSGVNPSEFSLRAPNKLALNPITGDLLVVDGGTNHRVLRYPSNGSTSASRVFGQNGATNYTTFAPGTNQDVFTFPTHVTFDPSGNMYIGDSNHRVLFYPSGSDTPTFMYGKPSGAWTCNGANSDTACPGSATINDRGLNGPEGVLADANNVYIGDHNNHRILIFPKGVNQATIVLGQTNFITGTLVPTQANCSATPSQSAVANVHALSLDSNGNLFATSRIYNRVMIFKPPFMTNMNSTYVLGQTSLTNYSDCSPGIAANKVNAPAGNTAFDSFGNFYLPDQNNNRVIVF